MTKPIEKWANFIWPADEAWKPVEGYPGYEVSDHGRIRTFRKGNARLRKPEIDKDGYQRMSIRLNGEYVHVVLHRLICEAFNGPAPEGMPVCCHRDGSRSNNTPSNLRWATQAENIADKIVHGTHQIGSKHGSAKITESVALEVKRLINAIPKYKGKLKDISRQTGASYSTVCSIKFGNTWRHV